MVSRKRDAAASRRRLLDAATAEFAARGFAGAKVDRIAAKARLNKAMIYYHFGSKAALYRDILLDVFRTIADAVGREPAGSPPERLGRFIRELATVAADRPHFAAIWLREMAEGAAHVDPPVVEQVQRILGVLGGIIAAGVKSGQFHDRHPLVVQLGIVGPVLTFLASAPARRRLGRQVPALTEPDFDVLVQHVEAAAIGALSMDAGRTPHFSWSDPS